MDDVEMEGPKSGGKGGKRKKGAKKTPYGRKTAGSQVSYRDLYKKVILSGAPHTFLAISWGQGMVIDSQSTRGKKAAYKKKAGKTLSSFWWRQR